MKIICRGWIIILLEVTVEKFLSIFRYGLHWDRQVSSIRDSEQLQPETDTTLSVWERRLEKSGGDLEMVSSDGLNIQL